MDRSGATTAVRVWSQPLSVDDATTPSGKRFRLINLPFYLVGQLDAVLENFAEK